MPLNSFLALIAIVIVAGGFTIWLGTLAGAAAVVPLLLAAMGLRVWLARK